MRYRPGDASEHTRLMFSKEQLMSIRNALMLTLLAGTVAGCPIPDNPDTPVAQWRQVDPVTGQEYFLYVPQRYSHNEPTPVIVSCHGTPPFDIAEHHIRTWKWYGEKYGCIILAPTLVGTDGILGDGPVQGMLENERRILSILSRLSYRYNIDRNNVMITGFSGGGFPAYWVGLRHPGLFSVIVAQNCNFNRSSVDGWYPPEATKTPVMVYWGENDPMTIQVQSRNAVEYLNSRGFKVETAVLPNVGHDRHPEVAMRFFRNHMNPPKSTMASSGTNPPSSTGTAASRTPPRRRPR